MLELDLILLPFIDNIYPTLSEDDQLAYQALLACEDQDIYAWCMNREEPADPQLQRIVSLVRANTGLQPSRG